MSPFAQLTRYRQRLKNMARKGPACDQESSHVSIEQTSLALRFAGFRLDNIEDASVSCQRESNPAALGQELVPLRIADQQRGRKIDIPSSLRLENQPRLRLP